MEFLAVSFVVDIARSRDVQALLAYRNRGDSANCSLLCLHSSDINSLERKKEKKLGKKL